MATQKSGGLLNGARRYLRETRSELDKVVWPTRTEATNLTIVVIAVTLAMAVFLGFMDYFFQQLLQLLF